MKAQLFAPLVPRAGAVVGCRRWLLSPLLPLLLLWLLSLAPAGARGPSPFIILSDPGSVGAGQFGFTILVTPGTVLRVETSSDLRTWTAGDWLTSVSGSVRYVDPTATNGRRFYRVRQQ